MVFRKQSNKTGNYVNLQGKRYDIVSCNITESKQLRQIGTQKEEIDGQLIEEPIMEEYIAINYGWDEFDSEEQAAQVYGLIYRPLSQGVEQ